MNLKEAFRYQNFLDQMFNNASSYLSNRQNVTRISQKHMRKSANPEAEDEVVDATAERALQHGNDLVIDYMMAVINEKRALSLAISKAKSSLDFDIDAEISVNKYLQRAAATLKLMASVKETERTTRGSAFKFNVEGNQAPYYYEVKESTAIDFSRDKTKRIAKVATERADTISGQADRYIIETELDFQPKFNMSESFEETVDSYVSSCAVCEEGYIQHAV